LSSSSHSNDQLFGPPSDTTVGAAAVERSGVNVSFAADRLFKAWRFCALLLLICGGVGVLSVALGPDNYWDLRYYHLYAPWAYLHDRYLYDVGPAQEQGFLNPTADLIFYGLISSPLNETPRLIAFIMGAMHGINAAVLFAITSHVIRPAEKLERRTLTAVTWLIGVSGAGFVSLIGTATNDLTSSLFVMGALLGVIKVAEPRNERGARFGFGGAGLLAGIGIGLKYTSAIYIPGLGAVALLVAIRRRTVGGVIAFGGGALLGFLAVAGHHMLTLWLDFGNPTFPYLNQIFHSPYWEPEAVRDVRFLPQDLWQLITYPFYWTTVDTYIVAEPPFRDWRAAIAYVAAAAGLTAFAVNYWRNGYRRPQAPVQTRGLDLVLIFAVPSYFSWALGFAYYRYAIPLEMLTGVVAIGMLISIFDDRRLRIIAAILSLLVAATTTVYLDWGRGRYGDRYVDVRVPALPAHSVVLIATWDPVAFFIPYAEPTAQYLGIENNYLELSQDNKLASEVKRIMRTPGRPKFILNIDENTNKSIRILGQFGLRLAASPCQPIWSNLEGHTLSLCQVADD
jgi:Dolichyl-phosphate-mannose-protein mannosyltransferase